MAETYYLQNIAQTNENPRFFQKPTKEEISSLKVGDQVRLFFVLKFDTGDGCRAERMWVEITEVDNQNFKGELVNQPRYIKELSISDIIDFRAENIATILLPGPSAFDENMLAIITERAWNNHQINWVIKGEPNNERDSGWQLYYGDEDDEYLSDIKNALIKSLEEILACEPLLNKVFASNHDQFEWSEDQLKFVEVHD